MPKEDTLEISVDEAILLFSSEGEFVYQLSNFVNTQEFDTYPAEMQALGLYALEGHKTLYKRLAAFLEHHDLPAMPIYKHDIGGNIKPKGGI